MGGLSVPHRTRNGKLRSVRRKLAYFYAAANVLKRNPMCQLYSLVTKLQTDIVLLVIGSRSLLFRYKTLKRRTYNLSFLKSEFHWKCSLKRFSLKAPLLKLGMSVVSRDPVNASPIPGWTLSRRIMDLKIPFCKSSQTVWLLLMIVKSC